MTLYYSLVSLPLLQVYFLFFTNTSTAHPSHLNPPNRYKQPQTCPA